MITRSQTITVRPMREADVEPLAAALDWPPGGIRARWNDSCQGNREIFVAVWQKRVAGSVSINVHPGLPDDLHLFALDVSPLLQRRGIGAALIARVEQEAARRSFDRVWLDVAVDNHGAKRLYERMGFEASGETVTLSYSVPETDGKWRDVEELCHRMFNPVTGAPV